MELATRVGARSGPRAHRPVILATLGVPFEPAAAAFAVDSAVESGQALVVVNVVELPPLGMSVVMGYDQLPDSAEDAETLRAPADLARSLGVEVERLRVRSPRPVVALLEVVAERSPGVLVFGPERGRLGRRAYRKAAKAVRERAPCLVWLPEDAA
ncbi:MAG TPA: universal stress protein [Gaiellaceae bacterium]|nr:universal stress protein [Gaiellaceae bacterium]